MSKKHNVGATEVRNHFGKFLNRVYRGEEHLVVEKGGIPVAALIGMREYEAFQRWLATQRLHELGPKLQADAQRKGLTEDQLARLLEEDRESVYRERYARKQG
jgi:prevent-host-death family protein